MSGHSDPVVYILSGGPSYDRQTNKTPFLILLLMIYLLKYIPFSFRLLWNKIHIDLNIHVRYAFEINRFEWPFYVCSNIIAARSVSSFVSTYLAPTSVRLVSCVRRLQSISRLLSGRSRISVGMGQPDVLEKLTKKSVKIIWFPLGLA